MAYKSPIELIYSDIQWLIEQETIKAVQRFFPLVDEEDLGKALKYDRDQYKAGFLDGRAARDAEIVRCKDCRWGREVCGNIECSVDSNIPSEYHGYEWFCPNGERRDDG